MSKVSYRIKKRKHAKSILKDVADNPSEYLIIHYSCESFFDLPEGNTPRVTSIAVRYVRNAQTHSFSIHKMAELRGIDLAHINQNYNTLERAMLDDFIEFVRGHTNYKWIHINMRNINFGFEAINHRYRVLGGTPAEINDNLKVDLAGLLIDLYGKRYSPHPRMENLYRENRITMADFMTGEEEANAFEGGDYVALHRSTLRKVDNMQNVITLANEDDLKVKVNLFQIYGISPSGLFQIAKENWIGAVILFVLGTIIGHFITTKLGKVDDQNVNSQPQNDSININSERYIEGGEENTKIE